MNRIKHRLLSALAGLVLAVPAYAAAANDNAASPLSDAAPAAEATFPCTGHLDEPMSEAFYINCLAPADGGHATQVANAMEHTPATKCPAAPAHGGAATCDPGPGTVIRSPTPRHGKTLQFISLEPVPFEFDKSDLTEGAKHTLDAITAYLLGRPDVTRVLLYGHADSIGTNTYNYTLSEKRIQTVTAYLVAQGVSPSLLHEAPRGERMPVDEYWTPEGRKRDRGLQVYAVVR